MTQLLYISPVPWASFAQRPHRFVQWFHQMTGGHVLWIDPYPTRLPRPGDFRRLLTGIFEGQGEPLPAWLKIMKPKAIPIEPLPCSVVLHQFLWQDLLNACVRFIDSQRTIIGAGGPSELALQILRKRPQAFSFYDAMDDFPAFVTGLSRWSKTRREKQLVSKVATVIVSSTSSLNRWRAHHPHVKLALNGLSMDAMPPVERPFLPAGRCILGYVGTIAQWFDWELVNRIAKANSDYLVRLIGPLYTPSPFRLPVNVELRPACDHATAITEMSNFSVGLIPFKLDRLTASVDPIKFYEYRALGLPVISTKFGEMALRQSAEGVFLIDQSTNTNELIRKATQCRSSTESIKDFRYMNTWDQRFSSIGLLDLELST